MKPKDATTIVCLAMSAGLCLGGFLGQISSTQRCRREAIEAGVAQWVVVDPKTGAVEFRYREVRP